MTITKLFNRSTLAAGAIALISSLCFGKVAIAETKMFELNDWSILGSGNYTDNYLSLSSNSPDVSDTKMENVLGLSSGTLDDISGVNATAGALAYTTIEAKTGDIINFNWFFKTKDYLPYDDFSFWSISNTATLLADVSMVGNKGSIYNSESYEIVADGTYTLGFGILDGKDTAVDSFLKIKNVTQTKYVPTQTKSVPEPTSMLGLLAVGAMGASSLLKRDREQQG
ncbi:MAG: PEP-CTERM sorting domain-containing protein [Prochloraceae cyanobacterium]|nr:PEP-CTERM sorting domain-containing protein [Prochloraceae cyanobacterium]